MKEFNNLINSNEKFSIFEEMEISKWKPVKLDNTWIDFIPDNCPSDQEFIDDIYKINNRPVLQKFNKIPLIQVPGSSAFKADNYTDVITSKSYIVDLYDSEDNLIPYGINQLEVYSDYITFKGGLPKDYIQPYYVSFVKYIGRKADNTLLRSDGSIKMDDDYRPGDPKDIATKEYVDLNSELLNNLKPEKPPTLKDAKLYLLTESFKANMITNGLEYNFIFNTQDIEIKSNKFFNTDDGFLYLYVNDFRLSGIEIKGGNYDNGIIFLEEVDSYADDIMANGFYTSKIATIKLSYNQIMYHIKSDLPTVSIRLEQEFNNEREECESLLFAIEVPLEKMTFTDNGFDNKFGSIKFISGVPSLTTDYELTYKFDLIGLKKSMKKPLGSYTYINKITNFYNEPSYPKVYPVIEKDLILKIPNNFYSETLDLSLDANNTFLEKTYITVQRPWRIDTVSDESLRLTSGIGMTPKDGYGLEFDSSVSLKDNEELQLINGIYKWPEGDYRCTNDQEILLDAISPPLPEGPNYNEIPSEGIRWATFKYEITNANGVYVSLFMPENITMNKITKETNWNCYVKVATKTGWLNGNTPYDGYGNPREDGDPAMVIYNSDFNTKYITFGNEPISGTLYVRIGLKKDGSSFKGVDITVNNK